jgi:DNA-nicking Smr family endonuclease
MKSGPFQPPDHGLWDDVRRTIAPLPQRTAKPAIEAGSHKDRVLHGQAVLRLPLREPKHRNQPPPLAAFDRRTAQRLSRGQLEPEARIDLHGDNLETARYNLFHFLESQRRRGMRLVLVITGKGASPFGRHTLHGVDLFQAPEREGRLRREMPHWLEDASFRHHVAGFQPAHPRHGGGGAFYLRLRKLNGPQ